MCVAAAAAAYRLHVTQPTQNCLAPLQQPSPANASPHNKSPHIWITNKYVIEIANSSFMKLGYAGVLCVSFECVTNNKSNFWQRKRRTVRLRACRFLPYTHFTSERLCICTLGIIIISPEANGILGILTIFRTSMSQIHRTGRSASYISARTTEMISTPAPITRATSKLSMQQAEKAIFRFSVLMCFGRWWPLLKMNTFAGVEPSVKVLEHLSHSTGHIWVHPVGRHRRTALVG